MPAVRHRFGKRGVGLSKRGVGSAASVLVLWQRGKRYVREPYQLVVGAIAALVLSASAQNTGSISGVIKDSSGGVIPGADVIVTNTQTGVETRTVSSDDGTFQFASVLPGSYIVTAELSGFKRYPSWPFEVHVGDRLTFKIRLEIGNAAEEVTVTADAPLLRTADAQIGEVINNNFICNLPQLNRNPFALLSLAGNVQGSGNSGAFSSMAAEPALWIITSMAAW